MLAAQRRTPADAIKFAHGNEINSKRPAALINIGLIDVKKT
jgi:hypothetical protein